MYYIEPRNYVTKSIIVLILLQDALLAYMNRFNMNKEIFT